MGNTSRYTSWLKTGLLTAVLVELIAIFLLSPGLAQDPVPTGQRPASTSTSSPQGQPQPADSAPTQRPETEARGQYLFWTRTTSQARDEIILEGMVVRGKVAIKVTRWAQGSYVSQSIANTEQLLSLLDKRLDRVKGDTPAKDMLPDVSELGADWKWPWKEDTTLIEAECRGQLRDPRAQAREALGITEELFQLARKQAAEAEKKQATEFMEQVAEVTSVSDQLGILQTKEAKSFAEFMAPLRELAAAPAWASNKYVRSSRQGMKPFPKDYDSTTLEVVVYREQAPPLFSEELLKRATEITKQKKEQGRKAILAKKEKSLERLKAATNPDEETRRQIKTLTEDRNTLESKKYDVGMKYNFKPGTKSFAKWFFDFSQNRLNPNRLKIKELRERTGVIALRLGDLQPQIKRYCDLIQLPNVPDDILDRLGLSQEVHDLISEREHLYQDLNANAAQAKTAVEEILIELTDASRRFDARHKAWFEAHIKVCETLKDQLAFEMEFGGGDVMYVLRLIEEGRDQKLTPHHSAMLAQFLLSKGEVQRAYMIVRDILRKDPRQPLANRVRIQAEVIVMELARTKASGALAEAREAFRALLKKNRTGPLDVRPRLSYDDDPEDHPWSALGFEAYTVRLVNYIAMTFGETPLETEERKQDTAEDEMVRKILGLPILIRLREQGKSWDDIRKLTATDLEKALSQMWSRAARKPIPLRSATGQALSQAQLGKLRDAILASMNYDEVRVLWDESKSPAEVWGLLQKPYLAREEVAHVFPYETSQAALELACWFLLPNAILTVGGDIAWGGAWSSKTLYAMRAKGAFTTVDAIAAVTPFPYAFRWLGSTQKGETLLAALKRFPQPLRSFQTLLLRSGRYTLAEASEHGTAAALMWLQPHAIELANTYGGEYSARVVKAVLFVSGFTGHFEKWLEEGSNHAKVMALMRQQLENNRQRLEDFVAAKERRIKHRNLINLRKRGTPDLKGEAEAKKYFETQSNQFDPTHIADGTSVQTGKTLGLELAHDAGERTDSGAAELTQANELQEAQDLKQVKEQEEKAQAFINRFQTETTRPTPATEPSTTPPTSATEPSTKPTPPTGDPTKPTPVKEPTTTPPTTPTGQTTRPTPPTGDPTKPTPPTGDPTKPTPSTEPSTIPPSAPGIVNGERPASFNAKGEGEYTIPEPAPGSDWAKVHEAFQAEQYLEAGRLFCKAYKAREIPEKLIGPLLQSVVERANAKPPAPAANAPGIMGNSRRLSLPGL